MDLISEMGCNNALPNGSKFFIDCSKVLLAINRDQGLISISNNGAEM
jgi:hypothetical protein